MISRNKYWFPDEDGTYALFYTWFYEPEVIAKISKDPETDDYICEYFGKLGDDWDYLLASTIEEAMEEVEDLIAFELSNKVDDLHDEIELLERAIKDFEGEDDES